jgi:hypothetical protein
MIGLLRNSAISKILFGFMAVYMVNICVVPPPLQSDRVQSQLSINEQESIVEIIVEKVLGFEDAVEDYDDTDRENQSKKTNHKLETLVHKESLNLTYFAFPDLNQKLFSYNAPAVLSCFIQIETPPPQS